MTALDTTALSSVLNIIKLNAAKGKEWATDLVKRVEGDSKLVNDFLQPYRI